MRLLYHGNSALQLLFGAFYSSADWLGSALTSLAGMPTGRLDKTTLLQTLLSSCTNEEIAEVKLNARTIAFGGVASISVLGTSTQFSPEDANTILQACNEAQKRRTASPTADGSEVPESGGHYAGFRPILTPQGVFWGG